MIIDSLKNAQKYESLNPLFKTAFDFLQGKDLQDLEDGKHDIAEGLKLIVSNGNGKTKETSLEKFECHQQNIDIQICVNGNETIGWKPKEKCNNPKEDYNSEKDVQFFNDSPDMFFQLTNGQFAIFYPEDVHAPMIGEGAIKKLVFKVKI
ncbi:YhcH/YjgK/YiaL family protein [Halpernia frigidisoli]|uniref:YhcH/YjgK/YiaL family protein n=1 Tax=Halpernia frigidisoli TaxID=1125876 RepID=A0A1I3IWZ7_9FLAO|nr:YhcH/YjgK/YiaL family protein [Halpernia frigidisoli]SFI52363.1 YhcH/YjgK/YiaL family protein [Halpernia frigidisoli]